MISLRVVFKVLKVLGETRCRTPTGLYINFELWGRPYQGFILETGIYKISKLLLNLYLSNQAILVRTPIVTK